MAKNKTCLVAIFFILSLYGAAYGSVEEIRACAKEIALKEVGVKEVGNNGGARVEEYQRTTHTYRVAWCASFINWVMKQICAVTPNSAYVPDWFTKNVIYDRRKDREADVRIMDEFNIYFKSLGRAAHIGAIVDYDDDFYTTIEGNSNDNGSREGTRVVKKYRARDTIYQISRWIK